MYYFKAWIKQKLNAIQDLKCKLTVADKRTTVDYKHQLRENFVVARCIAGIGL